MRYFFVIMFLLFTYAPAATAEEVADDPRFTVRDYLQAYTKSDDKNFKDFILAYVTGLLNGSLMTQHLRYMDALGVDAGTIAYQAKCPYTASGLETLLYLSARQPYASQSPGIAIPQAVEDQCRSNERGT